MKINLKIGNKSFFAIALLSVGITFADYVSIVDAKSAGGVMIEQESLPIGSVQMWYGINIPDGWLEMNGQSTAGYTGLSKIYGSNLPDLRGEFVRGYDNGRGIDAGRSIKSTQAELMKSHSHTIDVEPDGSGGSSSVRSGPHSPIGTYNTNATGGSETRPRNVALMYIVKAENVKK